MNETATWFLFKNMQANSISHRKQLQQYITKSYGSLISFNILFKNKSNSFVRSAGN
jgi:superoxide dismutase